MKKVLGVTFGSLQKKVVTLVMTVILLTVGLLALVSYFQNQMLVSIVEETRNEQQQAISRTSEETMSQILENSIIRMTVLEAQKAEILAKDEARNQEANEAVNKFKLSKELESTIAQLASDNHALDTQLAEYKSQIEKLISSFEI